MSCSICCGGAGEEESSAGVSRNAEGLTFKGVTSVVRLGDAGRYQLDADCHAEYPNSRMCRMSDLMEMYPAPVPSVAATVLHTGRHEGITVAADGSWAYDSGNCMAGNHPYDSTASYRTTFLATGNFGWIGEDFRTCDEEFPTACCGY
jgi:hypothetical protein